MQKTILLGTPKEIIFKHQISNKIARRVNCAVHVSYDGKNMFIDFSHNTIPFHYAMYDIKPLCTKPYMDWVVESAIETYKKYILNTIFIR